MAVTKVLVVDDSLAQLEHLKSVVAGAGYRVVTATSGREAVKKVAEEMPDLVFLDIVMDDLDGYGACREITKNPDSQHIPVVFVSTKNQRADRLWAERQGARGLISKPYQDEEIIAELKKY